MNIFQTHARIVEDYENYITSFLNISDPIIKQHVQAIQLGTNQKDFVVTSGTGSGKSLTYIGSIFHYLLSNPGQPGIAAIVVYPMNALINSQYEEFDRYKNNYEKATGKDFPITFGQYTGQEKEEKRQQMREKPPQILLTNYMMLELLLTRMRERPIRDAIYENLRFLVFDELHTYRGRQGADVALLIRRIRSKCIQNVISIGTSATMVSAGDAATQREQVAKVATTLFGRKFLPEQVVNEMLTRSLSEKGFIPTQEQLSRSIQAGVKLEDPVEKLKDHPAAIWLENRIALDSSDIELRRGKPLPLSRIVDNLDQSLNRWRRLYRSARTILTRATQHIESGTLGLGSDPKAVETFVTSTLMQLFGVQITPTKQGYKMVTANLPQSLRDLLPMGDVINISFQSPTPENHHYLGRNHRFVEQLCQVVMVNTLAKVDKKAARAAVIRTTQVKTKTTLMLFRCRNVIEQIRANYQIVAEEMLLWGWQGTPQQKEFLDNELKLPNQLDEEFQKVAEQQSKHLVESHQRFSALMDKQQFQVVYPVLPMDLLGIYILLPE